MPVKPPSVSLIFWCDLTVQSVLSSRIHIAPRSIPPVVIIRLRSHGQSRPHRRRRDHPARPPKCRTNRTIIQDAGEGALRVADLLVRQLPQPGWACATIDIEAKANKLRVFHVIHSFAASACLAAKQIQIPKEVVGIACRRRRRCRRSSGSSHNPVCEPASRYAKKSSASVSPSPSRSAAQLGTPSRNSTHTAPRLEHPRRHPRLPPRPGRPRRRRRDHPARPLECRSRS